MATLKGVQGTQRMDEIEIQTEDDIVLARQAARDVAGSLQFSLIDKTRVATAVSELARNTLVHGGGGKVQIVQIDHNHQRGIRCVFIDQGPGIADINEALGDGYSTGDSLGQGLPGSRRLTDDFRISSVPGQGTTVEITKWK